jgi:hypothetical protein
MPPMPLIATPGFARATSMTWRSAIGRTAWPE